MSRTPYRPRYRSLRRLRRSMIAALVALCVLSLFSAFAVGAAPSPSGATIASDLADYNPGGTVTLTGAGWQPAEAVHIVVNDTIGQTWQGVADVAADTSGGFTYVFSLPNYFVSDYDVTATGGASGAATTTFTDANPSADLDQCANDPAPSPSTNGCSASASDWVNGNLGASKAVYFEGDSIPYRLKFDSLSLNSHTVTIEWDTTKSGTHAIDYLTTFNRTVATANPCLGISGCGSSTTFAIPADPQVTGAGVTPAAGNFTLYGGTITSVSAYSYANGAGFAGDKSARITITFTASVANPVLAWGGHISSRADWGQNNSAVAIPGSPYHTRLIDLDGSGGNQDRSLSADAVVFPGSITIVKDATPNGSTSFGFTASPSPLSNFSLVDDGTSANTKLFSNITNFQTYTVNETPIPSGWGFDSVSCSVTSANGGSYTTSTTTASIAMNEGENWTCTYLNSLRVGTLTVIKHVVNDNGGTKTAADFTLHVKSGGSDVSGSPAAGSEAGTSYTLTGGAYVVSENAPPAGYTQVSISGDCDAAGNVTVVAGQNKTCTITNNDQAPALHLRKVVVNNSGGTAQATDWTLTASGPTPLTGSTPVDSGAAFSAGTYALSESGPSGYSASAWVCVGGTQSASNITLALGQSATCTITNDDQQAFIIVNKVVVNDNGGTLTADAFPLFLDGNSVTTGVATPVNPGSHSASETQQSGYSGPVFSGDCDSSGSVSVALGQTKTCTLTNDDQAAHLKLVKTVTNDNGGTASAADFTLSANGPTPISGAGGVESDVNPGTYNLSETTLPGYSAGSWSCVGGTQTGSSIALALGQSATCTINNDDQTAHLKLIKTVTNDNGGTASAADWTLTANGTGANDISGAGGFDQDVNADTYALSESAGPDGYTAGSFDCGAGPVTSVTLALGESKTCTINNDDQTAHLKLVKTVTNDNGGTATAADFTLSAGGPTPISGAGGVESDVNPGTYNLSETALPGYTAGSWSCVGGTQTGSSVALALGQSATCTINNDDQAAHLTLVKTVTNDNGGTATPANFTLSASGPTPISGPGGAESDVDAGSYNLSETTLPGYTAGSWSCVGGTQTGSSIALALGQSATCTINNDDQTAHLTLVKTVTNDNGGTATPANFTLSASGPTPISGPGGAESDVDAGSYNLSETTLPGYTAGSWSCVGGTQTGSSVALALGQSATCTINNNDIAPKLIVIKHVINNNGGTAVASDFSMQVNGTNVSDPSFPGAESPGTTVTLDAGAYNVNEFMVFGYSPTYSVDCDGTIGVGETKTCTITNNDIAPKLHLRKVVINDNGGTKTVADFTLTANGTGSNDLSGTSPVDSGVSLQADTWALSETTQYGYTASAWSCVGGTQSGSSITVGIGGEATCTITNDDQPGTIVIIKNAKPAQGSFAFTTTTNDGNNPTLPAYANFTLTGSTASNGNTNSQTLDAGTYTVKEGTQLSWILTGIGGSTDPTTPYNCVVTGSGGSTGVGDLGTQTATVSLKNGDTVTCTFENTGNGATRTQGFWATHSQLANIAWFGGTAFGHTFPGVAGVAGIGDKTLCGRPIDTLGKLMGAFWSDIAKTSTGAKRSALDQARMQLLQQLIAAELNASAFGSMPSSGSFAAWESAYCGTNQSAIKTAQQQAASFNTNGDSSTFTPGTSADSKNARTIANYAFWDVLP